MHVAKSQASVYPGERPGLAPNWNISKIKMVLFGYSKLNSLQYITVRLEATAATSVADSAALLWSDDELKLSVFA